MDELKDKPIHYIKVQPEMIKFDDEGFMQVTRKMAVKTAKSINDKILNEIMEIARNNGITYLVLLNEEFIVTALKNEIERREQGK